MADELDLELDLEGASPSVAGDMASSAVRGLGKGVTGLAGFPGDILSVANKAGDWVNQKLGVPGPREKPTLSSLVTGKPPASHTENPFVPTSEQLRSTIEEVTGNWGEAKTTPGKYMESVTSMIPSAMLGGGGLLAKGATAAVGGIGAEAGGEISALAGFGEIPGKIVGGMLGGGIGGAATATRTPRPNFEETFSTFQRLGLTPTAATTGVGGKVSQWLEANALPQAIGSANRMQKTMEGNLTQFTKKQQEIAANFGAPKTKAEMGEEVQKTVLEGWQGRKEEAGKIFNAIGQAFGPNDKFAPNNLLGALNKPIGSASTREVQAMTNASELQELDHLLTQTGGQLSYPDMIALKSKFGDMLDPRYAKPVNKAQIGQIVEALDRDIEGTIKTLGNKDVVRDWQYAKATYANAMQDYQQAFKKLLGTREMPVNAERVYDIMVKQAGIKAGADMESFKRVWGQLGKAKQGDLSATVLSHMGNKDPSKLGDMEGFSLPTFLTNYDKLSTDAKDMMFRQTGNQALEKSLDDLVLAANKMGVWPALASSSRSGTVGGMMAQVAAPAVFAATGKFSEAAKALLLNIGGPAAASTVLTDPKWVRRLAYAMDKVHGGMTGSTKALLGVVSQAQQEGLSPPQENSGGGNQIPQFAEGGVVTQPTVAMIGERGPEAVVPLDNPAAAQQAADVAAARVRAPYAKAQAQHPPSGLLDIGDYYGHSLMNAMTAPRDALTGQMSVIDTEGMPTPEAMQRGRSVANMAMTGGIPMAQRGALGMAGGKLGGPGEPIPMRNPSNYNKPGPYTAKENRIEAVKAIEQEIQKAQQEGNTAAAEFHKKEWSAWHGGKPWPGGPGDRINFQSAGAQRGSLGMAGGKMPSYEQWLKKNKTTDSTKAAIKYQAELEGGGELKSAYDGVVKDLGTKQIPISDLIKRSGLPKEEVHKMLLEASKRGEVDLHPSTVGSGIPADQAAGAIHHPAWNDPVVDVVFK